MSEKFMREDVRARARAREESFSRVVFHAQFFHAQVCISRLAEQTQGQSR